MINRVVNFWQKFYFQSLVLFLIPLSVSAQTESILLVIPNQESKILLDGMDKGIVKANSSIRLVTVAGEHYVEAQSLSGLNKGELIQLEADRQKILKIEFQDVMPTASEDLIQVADLNFNLPGNLELIAWQNDGANKGRRFPVPEYYYAFEKGDEIVINLTMSNLKGTNKINISTYPDGIERYTNNSFIELKDLIIKVPERAIYRFAFTSNHILARNAYFKLSRRPSGAETAGFNSNVIYKRTLTPVSIIEPQDFYIHGGLNATFSTGKSRTIVPVKLPDNTAEWFYRFSASRDPEHIADVKANFGLLGDITKLLFNLTGPVAAVTSLAVEGLSQPPGANICDIYFLEYQHIQKFEEKHDDQWQYILEGSRQNFKAGNVKISCCNSGIFYLGIKNPDSSYGIHVSIEVVALIASEGYVMQN